MYDVVLLTLGSERDAPGGGCGGGGACCGGAPEAAGEHTEERCETPRVPVLACADALTARGARVETVTARSDAEIDEVLARLDGPPRPDGLTWPDPDSKTRLVVATASDGQLRAVLRRLVRRYAPPPSRRPADLPGNRTVPDLPPVGVLPLDPARSGTARDLAAQLGLPRDPAEVAAAVLDGTARRLDLLRNDGGSVTLDGALLGAADDAGRPLHWRARVEVDGTVLSTGEEPIMACAVGNAGGYARLDDVVLLADPDPTDGRVEVAVAVPVVTRSALGRKKVRLEVRRARGRAAAVVPRDEKVPFLDDGVEGELSRKRSWWTEPGAWAVWTA
ncbi:diacylglycerol kinase family protein [Micromonospora chaiyaphumensis]|uniref:Diacylglycerol kinase catalytic domain-containing protein n=1 Tax=Micromonospora chaiyaphumensis TaxID=307119 RepID=A0A1C4XKF8_9ACTN|nr:diacylglycerol kinase family protein [Micromonospora chaiyaphumensis]SCF08990.1 Diacylglycerol kinase catalytic domain-containing protein [Micromonospora chaiyaphumensis]